MSEELPRAAAAVVEAGRSLGLALDVREFPDGTRTAADAARAIGCQVDQIVKSLVFVADTEPVLVLTSGGNRVDVVKVGKERSAAVVRKADAG
ncbi:MAG TPA: YbaK/EbsC family protein, partial [Actinomycetes bacterium]|nr:YbaK/EbsC family protein [Actinomycetes bacterium]